MVSPLGVGCPTGRHPLGDEGVGVKTDPFCVRCPQNFLGQQCGGVHSTDVTRVTPHRPSRGLCG
jgi:hypothetical protein